MTPELIVALDVPRGSDVGPIVDALPDAIDWYKLGLELFVREGPAALEPLTSRSKRVFLDLKLHDIPRTVERAVTSACHHGVGLLTVHASGGRAMLAAAAAAAADFGPGAPKLVAVTTLTSLNEDDYADLGVSRTVREQAVALGRLSLDAGIDGVVTSVLEAPDLRESLGAEALLVTPGIRLAGGDIADQKRIATPTAAVQGGASHLVVGRPILGAPDPAAAAQAILDEIGAAARP